METTSTEDCAQAVAERAEMKATVEKRILAVVCVTFGRRPDVTIDIKQEV